MSRPYTNYTHRSGPVGGPDATHAGVAQSAQRSRCQAGQHGWVQDVSGKHAGGGMHFPPGSKQCLDCGQRWTEGEPDGA